MKEFTDQSTANRTEKAKRVLRALANPHDYKYFFGDGFPRQADLMQDAAAALEVLEDLEHKAHNAALTGGEAVRVEGTVMQQTEGWICWAQARRGKTMETFQVEALPEIDQRQIRRGMCPWCLTALVPGNAADGGDECPECGDLFVGKITIDD